MVRVTIMVRVQLQCSRTDTEVKAEILNTPKLGCTIVTVPCVMHFSRKSLLQKL